METIPGIPERRSELPVKTAVVFYSMNGNTAMVAGRVAGLLGADLIEIRPEKAYPDKGLKKFLWGGKSAVMAETPSLQPYQFSAEDYDRVIFGFPVWAANMAPPIRTFIRDNLEALKVKDAAAFACQSGNGAEKAFRKLAECLGRENLAATMVLVDPKDRPKPDTEQKIKAFIEQLP